MTLGSDVSGVLGRTEPRLWTPPLRELTPATSFGFDVNLFARDVLHHPYDPWQEWLAIHAGELLPDGRPRFRIVLVLVSRQNGKTEVPVVLSLYWQFVEAVPMILGTSTKLDYAKESWTKATKLAEKAAKRDDEPGRMIAALMGPGKWKRATNGEQESWTVEDSRYKIAASNEEGGRSLTIDRLICDELRQHHDWSAWGAAEPATNAVYDAQIWCLSNAGDDRSVVLNHLREGALRFIETGDGDPRIGLFEWSAPEDAEPDDIDALAQANPNLGRRKDPEVLLAKGRAAKRTGGDALTAFMTEDMCIRVRHLNPAIDPLKWSACLDPGDLAGVRARVALCLDLAPDGQHATLAAAAVLPDGRVRGELVKAWDGTGCTELVRRELPGLVEKIRPQTFGWLPNGPGAALAASLKARPGRASWAPPSVTVAEITSEVAAVCMGLADLVDSRMFAHSNDPLLNAHIGGAERLRQGDRWVFSRRVKVDGDEKAGHVDAAYAMAGAVHLARTLPTPVGKPRIIVVD